MTWAELVASVRSSLHRYGGDTSARAFAKHWLLTPGVRYISLLRLCQYLRSKPHGAYGAAAIASWALVRSGVRFGIEIAASTTIGRGLFIGHFGGIVVNGGAVIGANCNLSHDVTIGKVYRGPRSGCPTIGDNVFIGPGAKIVGNVVVGDGAAIGANCVVVDDVAPNAVVVAARPRHVSDAGSAGYINFVADA